MKILLESATPQVLSFIPREYPALINYTITNESTNASVSDTNITATTNGAYLQITEAFTLFEGQFSNIEITKTDGTLIYRSKILCTNQTISDFSMQDGEYVEDTTADSEYIIHGKT